MKSCSSKGHIMAYKYRLTNDEKLDHEYIKLSPRWRFATSSLDHLLAAAKVYHISLEPP